MSDYAAGQLMMFGAEVILIALLVLFLFRIRSRLGLSPLYVSLGVFQPIQVLLASSIYVEILPGMAVSPGSIIMFTASLFAVLLVYIREDAIEARKVIYGIMIANLTMTLLLLIFSVQLGLPGTLNFLGLPPEIFNQGARVMVTGTIVLFCDVILVIFIFEAMPRFITRFQFLRIYATMAVVLIFDTTAFATGAFFGQPLFRSILVAGIIGKVVMAAFYAAALTIYLRFIEPVDRASSASDQPFRDIFYKLTYREKYKIERQHGEEVLERGKREWETTFDAMSDWICLIDLEGRILRTNRAGEVFLGRPLKDIPGRICCELVHGPEWPISECPLRKMTGTSRREVKEWYLHDRDRWLMITVDPVLDEDGKMISAVHIVRDITKRKQAEVALQESEERFRAIFEQAAVGVAQIETMTGRFLRVNQKYCDIVGYTREELTATTFMTLIHPDDLQADLDKMKKLMEGEIRTFSMEKRYLGKDGSIIWVNLTASPLWAIDEQPDYHIAVVENITKRKMTEAAVQQRGREMAFLNILNQRISASLSFDQVIKSAIEGIIDAVHPDMALLFLREGERLFFKQAAPDNPEYTHEETLVHRVGECLCGLAVTRKKPIFSVNVHNDPRCTWAEWKKKGLHSFAALPLKGADKIIGVLGLASSTARDFERQESFLVTLSNQISTWLQNALLHEKLASHANGLEERVADRTSELEKKTRELERFNKLFVDRELRMVDLKKQIARFEKEIEELKYG